MTLRHRTGPASRALLLLLLAACDPAAAPDGDSVSPVGDVDGAAPVAERPGLVADGEAFVANLGPVAVRLHEGSVHLSDGQQQIGLRLAAVNGEEAGPSALVGRGLRVERVLPGLTEWWEAREEGLEQGWTVDELPAAGPVVLEVAVEGAARVDLASDAQVEITGEDGGRWYYRGLRAQDATGRVLPAFMDVDGDRVIIEVDVAGAVAPIVIDPLSTTSASTVTGTGTGQLGWAVAALGDLNGDTYEDAAVGAQASNTVAIYRGSSTGLGTTANQTLTGSNSFGYRLTSGDFNGDTFTDLAVTSQGSNGSVTIYYGQSGGTLKTTGMTTLTRSGSTNYGFGLAAGDVDGDGFVDLVVGERGSSSSGSTAYGRVMVYKGSAGGLSTTVSQTLSISTTLGGPQFGHAVALGDINKDGYLDLVVGAPQGGTATNAGAFYVYHGSSSGFPSTATASYAHATGSVNVGIDVAIGDVNGDGYGDVLVGGEGTTATAGVLLVFHGSSSGVSTTTASTTLSPGVSSAFYFGGSLAVGSTNGDSKADVGVGARGSTAKTGYVYHYETSSTGLPSSETTKETNSTTSSLFGRMIAFGDFNGDGLDDLLVGASGHSSSAGAWYTYNAVCTDVDGDSICAPFDCDDSSAAIGRASTRYVDGDGDGYGSTTTGVVCPAVTGYAATSTDCDDSNAAINPGASEICDAGNVDEDCDGSADNNDSGAVSSGKTSFYVDGDSDGYGGSSTAAFCDLPASGYTATSTDCNDAVAAINPGATEVCDASNTDEDCDGSADNNDSSASAATKSSFYTDGDSDGYGDAASPVLACDQPSGTTTTGGDCNDSATAINPGATEVCDASNTDEDCDGSADNNDSSAAASGKTSFYVDGDTDGYGGTTTAAFCDLPASGYTATSTDCNDASASIHPGATEVCDAANADEDCDSLADDLDTAATGKSTWYRDLDSDTYGGTTTTSACDQPTGYVSTTGDCNDSAVAINPGATEICDASNTDEDCDGTADNADTSASTATKSTYYVDSDADTYGSTTSAKFCDLPVSGYATVNTDCNDTAAAINPGATEICDASNTDEDCDGAADNNDTSASTASKSTYYVDADADTYGSTTSAKFCDLPASGYSAVSTDCDDTTSTRSPGNTEVCDAANVDEDCDSLADNNDSSASTATKSTYYLDSDADTYGSTTSAKYCDLPTGYSAVNTDCNDTAAAINPGATEICDASNTDEDCDGAADNNDTSASAATKSTYYRDVDLDTYGSTTTGAYCDLPTGYSAVSTDCNDTVAAINPGATEICDASNTDEDCDGAADNNDTSASTATKSTYYLDSDGDTYGSTTSAKYCDLPTGYSAVNTDCDDTTSTRSPGNTEVCDAANVDEDCDSLADNNDTSASAATKSTYYVDSDGDTYGSTVTGAYCDLPTGYAAVTGDCDDSRSSVSPAATEVCDAANTDEDCDGTADNNDSSASATGKTTYYQDSDTDGYGGTTTGAYCDLPTGYSTVTGDCNDAAVAINPGATEICDAANTDEDCDSLADNADSSASTATKSTYYLDSDGDTYGGTTSAKYCDLPTGYSAVSTDCNDTSSAINPGATEICDAANTDEDCDSLADNADSSASAATKGTYYRDSDADGYGGTTTGAYCDLPSGYSTVSTDCNDSAAAINPGATEICDAANTDEDCDSLADNNDSSASAATKSTYYLDSDGDTYGGSVSARYCDLPTGYSAVGTDCNDASASISPAATEICDSANTDEDCDGLADNNDTSASTATKTSYYVDSDGDGYGSTTSAKYCDLPSGYAALSTDCDDTRATVSPAGTEVCDASNLDEDCDGKSDDLDSSVTAGTKSTWYRDADTDGYGTISTTTAACDQPSGYVTSSTDCNDLAATISPAASEICDAANTDEDCDSKVDDADSSVLASTKSSWYTDGDGDGYGVTTAVLAACDQPSGRVALPGDCNDTSTAYNPAATDVCSDPNDYNCDGSVGYADADGDGFAACEECDDNDFSIKPTGIELCDGADNNCDGDVDEDSAVDAATWYEDVDGDGYGDAALSTVACEAPTGYVASDADCDDSSIAYNPAAPESCDDPNDYNCDGAVEYADADADGFPACTECDDTDAAVSPSGVEVCDGIDNNCDGVIDEDTAVDAPTWYADADFDNFGNAAVSTVACEAPLGYVADDTDCNDADSAFYPGAAESCDETTDYNCDGSVGYADADGDGYAACLECDDSDAAVNPGAGEVCDEIDNDCDGTIDLNASDATTWYIDEDGDGHGVDTETTTACAQPDFFAAVADDCDDTDGAINPEADEVCDDSIDNNCDDLVDVEDAAACQSLDTGDTGDSGLTTDDTAANSDGGGGGDKGGEGCGCASTDGRGEAGLLLGALALAAAGRRRRSR